MGWEHCRKPGQLITWPYAVERGIPCPPRNNAERFYSSQCAAYPFEIMEVGDSFLVPYIPERTPLRELQRVASAMGEFHKATGKTFTNRTLKEGIRCWRTG